MANFGEYGVHGKTSVILGRNLNTDKGGSAGTRCEFGGNPSHIHTIFEKSLDSPR